MSAAETRSVASLQPSTLDEKDSTSPLAAEQEGERGLSPQHHSSRGVPAQRLTRLWLERALLKQVNLLVELPREGHKAPEVETKRAGWARTGKLESTGLN